MSLTFRYKQQKYFKFEWNVLMTSNSLFGFVQQQQQQQQQKYLFVCFLNRKLEAIDACRLQVAARGRLSSDVF